MFQLRLSENLLLIVQRVHVQSFIFAANFPNINDKSDTYRCTTQKLLSVVVL